MLKIQPCAVETYVMTDFEQKDWESEISKKSRRFGNPEIIPSSSSNQPNLSSFEYILLIICFYILKLNVFTAVCSRQVSKQFLPQLSTWLLRRTGDVCFDKTMWFVELPSCAVINNTIDCLYMPWHRSSRIY